MDIFDHLKIRFPKTVKESLLTSWTRDFDCKPNPYRTGYGWKIPTSYRVKCADGKTRRVYATCYGNASRLWVNIYGDSYTIPDFLTPEAEAFGGGEPVPGLRFDDTAPD